VGRKKGSRNKDFEEERRAISERTAGLFFSGASEVPSFRELAKIAGVTPTTLRHYFPTRDHLLVAALGVAHESGKDAIARAAAAGEELPSLGASMTGYLNHFVFGFHARWRRASFVVRADCRTRQCERRTGLRRSGTRTYAGRARGTPRRTPCEG
jgi:AcrR family transcriptional regulator